MTAYQHEESMFDATALSVLSDISSKLYPESPDILPALNDYKHQVEQICSYINLEQNAYLLDFIMILIEGIDKLTEVGRDISESEYAFLQKVPAILSEYLISPSSKQADNHMLELLKDPLWIRPITEDEEKDILSSLNTADCYADEHNNINLEDLLKNIKEDEISCSPTIDADKSVHDIVEKSIQDDDKNVIGATADINSNQQELVDLICAELEDIIGNQHTLEYVFAEGDHEQCNNTLKNMADQADNISNAVNLIGLEGLSQCGKFISNNMNLFMLSVDSLNNNQVLLVKQWPIIFLEYLKNIHDSNSVAELLILLNNKTWKEALDFTQCSRLKELLDNPVFLEDEHEQRQLQATDKDVDLTLPDDVNQELLDGLLQDLPAQTEEFSTAIQILSDGGSLDNIDIAQRVAHTLKGAANVVGVNGIANLTHHLEDILQAQSKANALPEKPLIHVLVRASDCLESMAEVLLGIDTQPDDAVSVLQEILDWANILDTGNAYQNDKQYDDHDIARPTYHRTDTADSITVKHEADADVKPSHNIIAAENVLRIPVSLADDMLRLAGENLIYTSQIQEHINVISKKQDALDLHNQSLLQLSHDLEHLIDIQGFMPGTDIRNVDGAFDPLELDEYHEVHTISRRLIEIAADSFELSQELNKDLSGLNELVVNQNQLHKESEELVLRTRMVPIKTIIPRLKRGVRQASRLTGKQVELEVKDSNTFMDSEVLNSLIEPIMHVLRNAIDHGIEDVEERIAKGKKSDGTISLSFERKGNHIFIEIFDDGQGLDTDVIYSKALNTGLINPDEDLSVEKIQRLILEHGFTTKSKVTQVSGRGIGLDVVSVKIRDLKGSIEVFSNLDEGCRITLSLPISSFSTHSLIVRSRQYIYAISSHGVEEILYPGMGELIDVGDKTIYQISQEAYNAVLLDKLLDLPPDRRKIDRNERPALLVKDESGIKTAILVQDVIDSRDVVVKNMGNFIPKLDGIIGATVLGDGSVSPVIDLMELLVDRNTHQHVFVDNSSALPSPTQSRSQPHVLVVDDSLSARRSLAQFVEDMGFAVRTARDGMEAISIIETSKPDLLLVDMEMPKMNGLELTSHIRATPDINNIPVIMITSRSTEKHRKAAIDKGVNHYMVKPFIEDELALNINLLLEFA